MTAISNNVYFDVLDRIVNKYNNTFHKAIKMKPIDVTSDCYAECNEDSDKSEPKFKVSDRVRYTQKFVWRSFLLLAKLKMQFPGLTLLVT